LATDADETLFAAADACRPAPASWACANGV